MANHLTVTRILAILLLVAPAALSRVALADGEATFSHQLHIVSFKLACTDCHLKQPAGPPKVSFNKCKDCHGSGGPPPFKVPRFQRIGLHGFPHAKHDRRLACTVCHTLMTTDYAGKPIMDKKRCAACHAQGGYRVAEQQCVVCHGYDKKKVKPESHLASNWLHDHGELSQLGESDEHGTDCRLCHGEQACTRCHRERMPKSHNGLWRMRLHGEAASWDRESCKACHETGVCVRCHENTRPLNHTAAWASVHGAAAQTTDNETCGVCHRPNCGSSCHRH